MNRYSITKITPGAHGGDVYSHPIYMGDDVIMFDALDNAATIAREENIRVGFSAYNTGWRRWENIVTFNPDGTAINSFGERCRWTGNRLRYWEKI